MFTRCPECGTVFRVTANQLRVAQGDVRCGNCAHVFNAMEFLTDELPEYEAAADAEQNPTEDPAMPDIQVTGQDLESLEFDAPEQTWSEFFIEARAAAGDIALDGELEAITANPEEWQSMLAEIGMDEKIVPGYIEPDNSPIAANESPVKQTDPESPDLDADADADVDVDVDADADVDDDGPTGEYPEPVYVVESWKLAAANDPPGDAQAEDQQQTQTSELDASELDEVAEVIEMSAFIQEPSPGPDLPPWTSLEAEAEDEQAQTPSHRLRWAGAALILCAALGAQLMHYSRDALAAHPRYGEMVRDFYARLDERLYPTWALSAFSVRRSEALAGGTAPNALDIKAAVEVGGAYPVGLPLLRVTLRDQWANTVGSRIFVPAEYLAAELPPIVPPGTRIPVTLSLADPGTAARGYEVDLCLPRRQNGLECQLAQRPLRP
jgi:predicted Zn finger-like uncharacterized protein